MPLPPQKFDGTTIPLVTPDGQGGHAPVTDVLRDLAGQRPEEVTQRLLLLQLRELRAIRALLAQAQGQAAIFEPLPELTTDNIS